MMKHAEEKIDIQYLRLTACSLLCKVALEGNRSEKTLEEMPQELNLVRGQGLYGHRVPALVLDVNAVCQAAEDPC